MKLIFKTLRHPGEVTTFVTLGFIILGMVVGAVGQVGHPIAMAAFIFSSMIGAGVMMWVLWYSTTILGVVTGVEITAALFAALTAGLWMGKTIPSLTVVAVLVFAAWVTKKPAPSPQKSV